MDEPGEEPRKGCSRSRPNGPCKKPLFGNSDVCYTHAGMELTEAEKDARRANGTRGIYGRALSNPADQEVYDEVLSGDTGYGALRHQTVAYLAVQASRAAAAEDAAGQNLPITGNVLAQLLKALPPDAPAQAKPVEPWKLKQQLDRVLREHPELLLDRLPPHVQAVVRPMMRPPAPPGGAPDGKAPS